MQFSQSVKNRKSPMVWNRYFIIVPKAKADFFFILDCLLYSIVKTAPKDIYWPRLKYIKYIFIAQVLSYLYFYLFFRVLTNGYNSLPRSSSARERLWSGCCPSEAQMVERSRSSASLCSGPHIEASYRCVKSILVHKNCRPWVEGWSQLKDYHGLEGFAT